MSDAPGWLFSDDRHDKLMAIGLQYIQHLFETKRLTFNIRMDCETETGKLAAIHAFLCDNRDDVDDSTDLVIYGPCNNQQDKTVEGFA